MFGRYDRQYPKSIFSNPDRLWSDAEIVTAGCLYVQRRGATLRSLATQLGISKTTLHIYLTKVLPEIYAPLAAVVARKMSIMRVFPKNGVLKTGQSRSVLFKRTPEEIAITKQASKIATSLRKGQMPK